MSAVAECSETKTTWMVYPSGVRSPADQRIIDTSPSLQKRVDAAKYVMDFLTEKTQGIITEHQSQTKSLIDDCLFDFAKKSVTNIPGAQNLLDSMHYTFASQMFCTEVLAGENNLMVSLINKSELKAVVWLKQSPFQGKLEKVVTTSEVLTRMIHCQSEYTAAILFAEILKDPKCAKLAMNFKFDYKLTIENPSILVQTRQKPDACTHKQNL